MGSYSDKLFDENERDSPTSLSQDIRSNVPKKTIPPSSEGGHNPRSRHDHNRNQRKRGYNEINIRAPQNKSWQANSRFQRKDNQIPYGKRSKDTKGNNKPNS